MRASLPTLTCLFVPLLSLLGCSDDFGKPRTVETRDTAVEDEPCGVTVDATWPTADSIGHYYQDPIEFWLSAPDPNAEPVAPIPGPPEFLQDGRMPRFPAPGALETAAPYTFDRDQ
mgnify:CR=1 FL=1